MIAPGAPRRRSRGTARGRLLGVLFLLAAGTLLFLFGFGLGQALGESPPPAGELTYDRTLEPLPLGDTVTVTVTVTAP